MKTTYLIIGMNACGFYAAQRLVDLDPDAPVIAVDSESSLPYKRTKINKRFDSGDLSPENYLLAPETWYKEKGITLKTGVSVTALDTDKKTAQLSSGETIFWEKVLIAAGADSFNPGNEVFQHSQPLRTYKDALSIQREISGDRRCLVYGLGVLGIETACGLAKAGMDVTLAGRDMEILERHFSPSFRKEIVHVLHSHGLPLYYNIETESLMFQKDTFSFLSKGKKQTFTCMIHALGIAPRVKLASEAGIAVERGIVVDDYMRTSAQDVFAGGDCCQIGKDAITDLWHAAQHQGQCAAANMAGLEERYAKPLHRLKTELFGTYCFSMRPFGKEGNREFREEASPLPGGIRRLFYFRENNLEGVEMIGDKERSKLYEKAVNEHWSREKVLADLGPMRE